MNTGHGITLVSTLERRAEYGSKHPSISKYGSNELPAANAVRHAERKSLRVEHSSARDLPLHACIDLQAKSKNDMRRSVPC